MKIRRVKRRYSYRSKFGCYPYYSNRTHIRRIIPLSKLPTKDVQSTTPIPVNLEICYGLEGLAVLYNNTILEIFRTLEGGRTGLSVLRNILRVSALCYECIIVEDFLYAVEYIAEFCRCFLTLPYSDVLEANSLVILSDPHLAVFNEDKGCRNLVLVHPVVCVEPNEAEDRLIHKKEGVDSGPHFFDQGDIPNALTIVSNGYPHPLKSLRSPRSNRWKCEFAVRGLKLADNFPPYVGFCHYPNPLLEKFEMADFPRIQSSSATLTHAENNQLQVPDYFYFTCIFGDNSGREGDGRQSCRYTARGDFYQNCKSYDYDGCGCDILRRLTWGDGADHVVGMEVAMTGADVTRTCVFSVDGRQNENYFVEIPRAIQFGYHSFGNPHTVELLTLRRLRPHESIWEGGLLPKAKSHIDGSATHEAEWDHPSSLCCLSREEARLEGLCECQTQERAEKLKKVSKSIKEWYAEKDEVDWSQGSDVMEELIPLDMAITKQYNKVNRMKESGHPMTWSHMKSGREMNYDLLP